MNTITTIQSAKTMTSLEIVEVINELREKGSKELRHDNFMVKLEKHPGIDSPKFSGQYKDSTGRMLKCYHLPKREAELMVMSESLAVQARVYDKMIELEQNAPAIQIPQTFAAALRLAAEQAEQIEALAIERDKAVATKAQIGSKREATAMATASAAKREVTRLKDELGVNQRHATIVAVEKALGIQLGGQFWRSLKKWCDENGGTATKVVDPRWGEVKAWPAEAWKEVKGVDLANLFPSHPGMQS